jgi:hypothetical protein
MAPPISKPNYTVKAAQYQCQWTTVISADFLFDFKNAENRTPISPFTIL